MTIYTEDEASAKWCPHSRNESMHGSNRTHGSSGGVGCCIGSRCMAWRWERTHINDPENPNGDLIASTRTYGRCGLAGEVKE